MIDHTRNLSLSVKVNGKFVGTYCYEEGLLLEQLEEDLIKFAEPMLAVEVWQLVVDKGLKWADFISDSDISGH